MFFYLFSYYVETPSYFPIAIYTYIYTDTVGESRKYLFNIYNT